MNTSCLVTFFLYKRKHSTHTVEQARALPESPEAAKEADEGDDDTKHKQHDGHSEGALIEEVLELAAMVQDEGGKGDH